MQVTYTLFKSAVETSMASAQTLREDWTTFVRRMSKPVVTESKTDVKLLVPAMFNPSGKRCSDDVVQYAMLVLDYDSGMEPEVFVEKHKELEFVLATSHSHTDTKPKFRVYLPLTTAVDVEVYRKARSHFIERFPEADPASFNLSQGFYLPSCPVERQEMFVFHHNEGELLSTDEIKVYALIKSADVLIRRIKQHNEPARKDATLGEAEETLQRISPDVDYDTWLRIGWILKSMFGDAAADVWVAWSQQGASCDQTDNQLHSKFNSFGSGSTATLGSLVHYSKQYPS